MTAANIHAHKILILDYGSQYTQLIVMGANDYLVKSQVVIGDVVERVKHHLAS